MSGSLDLRGGLTWGTGTVPATGAQVAVIFGSALNNVPFVQLTESTAATPPLGVYVTSVSATGFTIAVQTAPAASPGNTTYGVHWHASI